MAFSKDEKERRIAAAEKRLATFQERGERFAEKHAAAVEDAQREIEALDWLQSMPTEAEQLALGLEGDEA